MNDQPVDISTPAAMSFRVLMRVEGVRHPKRAKRRRDRSSERVHCVRCGRLSAPTVDHIVPQARLSAFPEVRDDWANKQLMCSDVVHAHTRPDANGNPRYWVERYGCNALKADGPAVDYRPDRAAHERLLSLLDEYGVGEQVRWEPVPWRGGRSIRSA